MELWLDTSHLETIKKANRYGIIHGVTTNPSIIAKSQQDPAKLIPSLLSIQQGPVAVQVTADNSEEMIKEAKFLAEYSNRIIVKVPVTREGLAAIHSLSKLGISTMATALFHPNQAYLAALAGANYVAPYLGRMFDEGIDAWSVLQTMLSIYKQHPFKTKILVAALKSTEHITLCAEMGVHAITIKRESFEELLTEHPLTEQWVKIFAQDWEEVQNKFPSKPALAHS